VLIVSYSFNVVKAWSKLRFYRNFSPTLCFGAFSRPKSLADFSRKCFETARSTDLCDSRIQGRACQHASGEATTLGQVVRPKIDRKNVPEHVRQVKTKRHHKLQQSKNNSIF
jgi:hypothetical protein